MQLRDLWYIRREEACLKRFISKFHSLTFTIMNSHEVVLVTGANTGLGFQIIRSLCSSDRSYNILLAGRSHVKAEEAVSAARKEFPSSPSKLWPIQVDIEDDNSIERAFKEVKTKFGKVDALINNAGMFIKCRKAAHILTGHRRPARPTIGLRENDHPSNVEPILELQHNRHANNDNSFHPAVTAVKQSASPFHHKRHLDSGRDREYGSIRQSTSTQRLAENQLQCTSLPEQ